MLERWIAACRVPMVIASHDRRFLDACTTRTLFLRPGVSRLYAHPYTRARHLLAEDDAAQEAKLAKDTREVDRLRRNANELKNVGINSGSDLLLKKSKQLRERAAALEQTLASVHAERSGDIRLANRGTHAKVMLALAGRRCRAPDGRLLFRIDKLDIFQQDRIVVLGRNGVGKSQFVRLLRRALAGDEVPGAARQPDDRDGLRGSAHVASAGRGDAAWFHQRRSSGRAISAPSACWPVRGSAWTCSGGRSRGSRSGRRRGLVCWRCG